MHFRDSVSSHELLKTCDYIQATEQIRSAVYKQALRYNKTSGGAG